MIRSDDGTEMTFGSIKWSASINNSKKEKGKKYLHLLAFRILSNFRFVSSAFHCGTSFVLSFNSIHPYIFRYKLWKSRQKEANKRKKAKKKHDPQFGIGWLSTRTYDSNIMCDRKKKNTFTKCTLLWLNNKEIRCWIVD